MPTFGNPVDADLWWKKGKITINLLFTEKGSANEASYFLFYIIDFCLFCLLLLLFPSSPNKKTAGNIVATFFFNQQKQVT